MIPIVEVSRGTPKPRRNDPSVELLARADRRWRDSPPQPDPQRIDALLNMLPPARTAIDIGSGHGELARRLPCTVTTVDAASLAKPDLRAALPYLPTHTQYDLVICTHLFGELDPSLYRYALSTLASLTKPNGHCLLSTDLDPRTSTPLDAFYDLFETEFRIVDEWERRRGWRRRITDVALLGTTNKH